MSFICFREPISLRILLVNYSEITPLLTSPGLLLQYSFRSNADHVVHALDEVVTVVTLYTWMHRAALGLSGPVVHENTHLYRSRSFQMPLKMLTVLELTASCDKLFHRFSITVRLKLQTRSCYFNPFQTINGALIKMH